MHSIPRPVFGLALGRLQLPLTLVAAVALSSSLRADESPQPRVVDHLHATSDFIDDPFAISADGTRIAWVTTDCATRSSVHLAKIGDPKSAVEFPFHSITADRVEFLDAERVIAIDRDAETRLSRAEVYGPGGAAREKFGPATEISLANVDGTPAIVTWLRAPIGKGKALNHTFAAYRTDNLKQIGKKVLVESAEGRIQLPGGPAKPLYFANGYSQLVAQMEGSYDKAKDIRRPDVEARLDVFTGKLVGESEIKDVVKFAQFALIREKYQGHTNFVRFTDDKKAFELVDDKDVTSALQTPRPLSKYDPETLAYFPAPDGGLYVSLTIDPQHAEAVKAQKSDKDWLDIYHLDLKTKEFVEVARIDGQKRATSWRYAGGRLGVLRKHKGFGRGGEDMDIFELGAAKADAAPVAGAAPAAVAAPAAAPPDAAPAAAPAADSDGDKKAAKHGRKKKK